MCERSQPKIWQALGLSGSSPEDSPAPTSPRREGAWDSSEEDGVPFGWRWSGSFVWRDRLSSSLRTFLLSTLAGSTPYSLGWRRRVTPRGRWWWGLGRSGLRTGGTGSGSLEWKTPTVPNGGRVNIRGTSPTGRDPAGRKRQVDLAHEVRMMATGEWPTITICGNNNRKGASPTSGDGLATAAREWPTPKEVDGRTKGNAGLNRNSPGLDALAKGGLLAEENPSTHGSRPGLSLDESSTATTWPRNQGRLNPDWVEALMGAPPGWTDLPGEVVSELWATRTRLKSRS